MCHAVAFAVVFLPRCNEAAQEAEILLEGNRRGSWAGGLLLHREPAVSAGPLPIRALDLGRKHLMFIIMGGRQRMSRRKGGCRPQCAHSPALEAGKTARQVLVFAARAVCLVDVLDEGPHELRARSA